MPLAFLGSPSTLLILAVVGLLLFDNRLPEVMKNLGRGVSEFKKGIDSIGEPLDDVKSVTRDINRDIHKF